MLGFWPGDGKWYQAQVNTRHGYGRYILYFPEDDSVYVGAPPCHLKCPGDKLWARVSRTDYANHKFEHKKQEPNTPAELGTYTVQEVRPIDQKMNKYMCEHSVTGNKHLFNMGYVQRKLLKTLTGEWKKW